MATSNPVRDAAADAPDAVAAAAANADTADADAADVPEMASFEIEAPSDAGRARAASTAWAERASMGCDEFGIGALDFTDESPDEKTARLAVAETEDPDAARRRNAKAGFIVLASAFTASVWGLDAKLYMERAGPGGGRTLVLLATSFFGAIACGFAHLYNASLYEPPPPRSRERWGWVAVRSFIGGSSMVLSFVAISELELSVAN